MCYRGASHQPLRAYTASNPVLQARVSVCDTSRFQEQDASHPRCLPTSTSHCLADVDLFPDLMLIPLLPSHPGRLMTCRRSLTDCILLGLRSSPLHHDRPENTTDAVIHDSLPSYYSSSAYALQSTRCRNSRGYIPTAQMLYTRANHGKSL